MKNTKVKVSSIIAAGIVLTATLSSPSYAIVVSDPGAYTRFAQALSQSQKEHGTILEQLDVQKKVLDAVSGNLKRGKGIDSMLSDLISSVKDSTISIHNIPDMNSSKIDMSDMNDIQKTLDELYVTDDNYMKQSKNYKYRELYKQRTVKAALENSEFLIAKQEEGMTRIQDLSKQIDETKTFKDAQDLTNRFLAELLTVQNQQLLLLAQLTRAEQALKFEGVATSGKEDINEDMTEEEENAPFKKQANGHYIDTNKLVQPDPDDYGCKLMGGCK